ncbi:MAG: hypothetical protein RLN81_03910 [Balneolaceae bacterium]
MEAEEINKKIEITWKAVELFEKKGKVSISELVKETGFTSSEIYALFPNKHAILEYYYPALVLQYWAMIEEIEGFESYSLSEKFSNFAYTTFDMMSENEKFLKRTFNRYVFQKGSGSAYHGEVTELLKHFLTSDAEISVSAGFFMKSYYYSFLSSQFLFLLKYWMKDTSEGKERTLALTDKLTSLLQESVYNKTIDMSFDLLKYIFTSSGVEKNIPFLCECTTKDKDEEKEDTDNE